LDQVRGCIRDVAPVEQDRLRDARPIRRADEARRAGRGWRRGAAGDRQGNRLAHAAEQGRDGDRRVRRHGPPGHREAGGGGGPGGRFRTGGGLATRLLVESVTDAPPAGAGPLRSTVPDTLLPPTTVAEASVTEDRRGCAFGSGATLMKTDFVTPPAVASTSTVVPRETGLEVMVKLFALLPAAMDTVGGTWTTDGLVLVSVTAPPPGGASITSETVPRVEAPPIRFVGLAPNARRVEAPAGAGSISRSVA